MDNFVWQSKEERRHSSLFFVLCFWGAETSDCVQDVSWFEEQRGAVQNGKNQYAALKPETHGICGKIDGIVDDMSFSKNVAARMV